MSYTGYPANLAQGGTQYTISPAFTWYLHTSAANVTGDNTIYTLVFDTELFDENSSFNGTTFTAPVTGIYTLGVSLYLSGINDPAFTIAQLVLHAPSLPGTDAILVTLNPDAIAANNDLVISGQALVNLNATQTVTFSIQVGNHTKTVGLLGSVDVNAMACYAYGYLFR